jgi:endonuclease G
MKKKYMSPVAEVLELRTSQMMAGSVSDNGESINFDGMYDEGDAGDACVREFSNESDWSNMLWTLLLMLLMTLNVSAQDIVTKEPADVPDDGKTHAMKLYLKNQTTVEYTLSELEHVTYLPGVGMKVYVKNSTQSADYLFTQLTKIEYAKDGNANANWEMVPAMWTNYQEAWRLEYPQLSSNLSPTKDGAESKNQIIVKRTDDYGITYSLEWDNAKIANRWTCYQLHEGNSMSSTDRHDDFKADPEVAVSSALADYSGSGFSRGHLCPSADRLCSEVQNKQTFFLTNMQPQYQSHNGGLWSRLETQVRDFATDDTKTGSHCDTLYIVKAATITDKVTINDTEVDGVYAEKCNDRLLIPKYFYMALLHYNKTTDTYHALAFWTEHINTNQSVTNLGDYAITIDELEKRTGIDFFCNLPDVVEESVESTLDLDFWKLTVTP